MITPTDTVVSEERLREILDGCEGVTPGPWGWAVIDASMASLGVMPDPGHGDPHVLSVSPCKSCRGDEWEWGKCLTPNEADASHIARLDPATVASMARELLSIRTTPSLPPRSSTETDKAVPAPATGGEEAWKEQAHILRDRVQRLEELLGEAALRRDEGKGVREALEALRPFVEAFAKADDPGVSDLYDEQPFSLHVNLGAWRRARSAWRALSASPAPEEQDYFGSLVERARAAAAKASVKFPQPNYVTLKIAEEAGEVVRGAVHYAENRMEWSEVEGEVVQLLAMLIRFVTEGDEINGVKPPAPLPRSTTGGAK